MKGEGEASLQDFLGEAEDILEALQEMISEGKLVVKRDGIKREAIDEIFRNVHSLKGLSSCFALAEIVELCQLIERILLLARVDTSFIDEEKLRLIADLIDTLHRGLEAVSRDEKAELNLDKKRQQIEDFLSQFGGPSRRVYQAKFGISRRILKSLTKTEEDRLFNDIDQGKLIYFLVADASSKELKDILPNIGSALQQEGDILANIILPATKKPGQVKVQYLISTTNKNFASAVKQLFPKYKLSIRCLEKKISTSPSSSIKESESLAWKSLRKISRTLRIDISRLNRLQEALAEIFLAKAYLDEINKKYYQVRGYSPFFRENTQALISLERKLRYLQERIIESRLVPIRQIFNKLNRTISKMLTVSDKAVELITSGSETELDGAIVEQLSDPLMHIIRNAIDHGIESREIRKQKGKEEIGKIFLRAYPRGNRIFIEVEDDGQGIDIDKIRRKAVEKNLITPDRDIKEEDLLKLIYHPGFSTKDTLSQISGMGVGMDVVKKSIAQLGGSIDAKSTSAKGTKFTISVPITLAILKVALVKVSSHILAIPLVSVTENLRITAKMIKKANGHYMLYYQNNQYPLLNLKEEFKLKPDIVSDGGKLAIIAGLLEDRVCLRVDSLLEQRDVIIMPLGKLLSVIPGLAGAAEIGKKRIALVLDMGYFVARGAAMIKKDKIYKSSASSPYFEDSVVSTHPSMQTKKQSGNKLKNKVSLPTSLESEAAASDKFLMFYIADQPFAVDCAWVQEVAKGMEVTPLLRTKPIIEGISRFRGGVIPILNLRAKRIEPFKGNNGNKLVIVIKYKEEFVGLAIDKVGDIINLKIKKIYKSRERFSSGTFNYQKKKINLLNLDMMTNLEAEDILL